MRVQINEIGQLRGYLRGVVERADHHAPNVREVLLILAGLVVLFKDEHYPIEVRAGTGSDLANQLWVHIGGTRYAFSYDHTTQSVQVKEGGQRGNLVASFDNATPAAHVINIFEELS